MGVSEVITNGHSRAPSRAKRPRSAVTSGRELFIDGDPNSAWSRRFHDLIVGHVNDVSAGAGPNALSDAQLSLIRRCASIECELERLDAMLSRGEAVDMDAYARVSGHLRRLFETLGLERRQKTIGPSLGDLIVADQAEQRAKLAAERAAQRAQREAADHD
jgi:hypothetical protein